VVFRARSFRARSNLKRPMRCRPQRRRCCPCSARARIWSGRCGAGRSGGAVASRADARPLGRHNPPDPRPGVSHGDPHRLGDRLFAVTAERPLGGQMSGVNGQWDVPSGGQ